jgi:sulfotransferase
MSLQKYNFLSGLPRSGNTLLSALLNQNPRFYSSPISPVCDQMYNLHLTGLGDYGLRNFENLTRTTSILTSYMPNFYSDINSPVIFDREKYWTSPDNLNLILKYITPKPKVLFTVRTYVDILASYVSLAENQIENEMNQLSLFIHDLPKYDKMAEYLSRLNSTLDVSMLCLRNALKEENKEYVHIIDYQNLMNDPNTTMKNIYNFLEEDFFKHDFYNINKLEKDNDEKLNLNPQTHFVSKELTPSKTRALEFFSKSTLIKYSQMDVWKTNLKKEGN